MKINLLALSAAILYGIVHDQVTIRLCQEYFTIGHPTLWLPELPGCSATWLALAWGVLSTWWVGLPFGYLLASACRNGRRPQLTWRDLLWPIAKLLLIVGATAAMAGASAFLLAERGVLELSQPGDNLVATDLHSRYLATRWAHGGSYAAGVVGCGVLILLSWRRRGRP